MKRREEMKCGKEGERGGMSKEVQGSGGRGEENCERKMIRKRYKR